MVRVSVPKDLAESRYAYTTLLTRASYLGGVIVLAHTLRKHGSIYPLIVFYPPNRLEPEAIEILKNERESLGIHLRECEYLELHGGNTGNGSVAGRFADTWTKLRVFEPAEGISFEACCYLDADMAIFNHNMDAIFSTYLPHLPNDGIAATHCCVCNLDNDSWCPPDWQESNCVFSAQTHPTALVEPAAVPPSADEHGCGPHRLLNSGLFLYRPSRRLWDEMIEDFRRKDKDGILATYQLPDQDFLASFFRDRWCGITWQWNALKTWRYWHKNIWRDDQVTCLHYIVDKPFANRVRENGAAGYKGLDQTTHQWWWDEYEDCRLQRIEQGSKWDRHVEALERFVAPKDEKTKVHADLVAIGCNAQD